MIKIICFLFIIFNTTSSFAASVSTPTSGTSSTTGSHTSVGHVIGSGTKDLAAVISEWRNENPLVNTELLKLESLLSGGPFLITSPYATYVNDPFILMLRSEPAIFDFIKFYAWTGSAHAVEYISSLANGNPSYRYEAGDPRRELVNADYQRISNSRYLSALFGYALYSHETLSNLSTIKCVGTPLVAYSQVNPKIKSNTIECVEMYGANFSSDFDRYMLASKVDFNLSEAELAIERYNPAGLPSGLVDDIGELKKRIYSYGAFFLANAEDSLVEPSVLTAAVANVDPKIFSFLKPGFATLMEAVDGEDVNDPELALLAKQNGLQSKVLDALKTSFPVPVSPPDGEGSGTSGISEP